MRPGCAWGMARPSGCTKPGADMENTALVALSRQIALRREMAVISNNVANINTQGFKRGATLFEEYLGDTADAKPFEGYDRDLSYVWDRATLRDMDQGAMQVTGNELDFAVDGEGYFVVETPRGERFTRDGAFSRSEEGFLVTTSGYPVLGQGGLIEVPEEGQFTIEADGTISVDQVEQGRLRLVSFDAMHKLDHEEGNLLASQEPGLEDLASRVRQGTIERSNVIGVVEMTRMIDVQRAYQSLANVQQNQDDMRRKAIETLGRLA